MFYSSDLSTIYRPLISLDKVLLPVFHIKSGVGGKILACIFKQNPIAYEYVKKLFGNNFVASRVQGKQVNILLKDQKFLELLSPDEKLLWEQMGKVVFGFLGKNRHPKYKQHAKKLITLLAKNNIGMSPKIHLIKDHLDKFPESCSDFSDEAGERLHQEIKDSIRRTRNKPPKAFLVDYCWRLMRDNVTNRPSRKLLSKLFF